MPEERNSSAARIKACSGLTRWLFGLGLIAFLGTAYFAGHGSLASAMRGTKPAAGHVLYYVDPMHPAYRSDRPGKAPDCGMDLEPVYSPGPNVQPTPARVSNAVVLTPSQEQAAQFETETAQAAPLTRTLRTAGRVAPDEALTFTVSAGVDGWVRRVFSDRTGTLVKRGTILASFYSKDISAPQQAYVYALESCERLRRSSSTASEPLALATQQLTTARDNLLFLGMDEAQIEELTRTRREISEVNLASPADGLIVERGLEIGKRFMKGESLYRIAALAHVWVLADINPGDAARAAAITKAQIRVDDLPPIDAHVSPIPPRFDDQGRTGKLRLEANNLRGVLVPGMIVNVVLHFAPRPTITVHVDAVIDSGARQSVFVTRGGGNYELRHVVTGSQEGDHVEILEGLRPGERVVKAGAFLLDSESRLKTPPSGLAQ